MARWAAFINRHRDPQANWLTVDAGNYVDRVGASGGCSRKCQFLVTSYEGLHYDVLNIARQEVSMGYETLVAMRDTTSKETKFVSANLIDVNTGKPLFDPYVIRDYGNMKIGIMGLLRPADYPAGSSTLDTVNLRAESFMDAAAKYLPTLARKCDGIVVLAELATADIEELVAAHPEINLVVSTGALRSGEQVVEINKTRVIGTGSSGYNGHWVSMEFNPAWADSIAYNDYHDQLTDTYDEKGEWADKLAIFEGSTAAEAGKPQPKVHTALTGNAENVKKLEVTPTTSATATPQTMTSKKTESTKTK